MSSGKPCSATFPPKLECPRIIRSGHPENGESSLVQLDGEFQAMYSREGRPCHPPGEAAPRLVAASLLHHAQRSTMDGATGLQSPVSLAYRSFHGQQSPDHSVFSKNQKRFLGSDLAAAFRRVREPAATAGLLSDKHFTVDGILIKAWASLKSFHPKDTPPPSGGGVATRKWVFMVNGDSTKPTPPPPSPEARLSARQRRRAVFSSGIC